MNCKCNNAGKPDGVEVVKKRIGKDLRFTFEVLTNGEPITLDGRKISIEITAANGTFKMYPSFEHEDNVVTFDFLGIQQKFLGVHTMTVWENFGEVGQTAVDRYGIVELVRYTWEET